MLKKISLIGLFSLLLAPATGFGAARLSLDDGGGAIIIFDEGAGDAFAGAGTVTFLGAIGVWNVNITSGLTNPTLPAGGPPPPAVMDVSTVNTSSSGGMMTIMFTDDGTASGTVCTGCPLPSFGSLFGPPYPTTPIGVTASIGGTSAATSTITFDTYIGAAPFAMTTLITSTGSLSGPAFGTTIGSTVTFTAATDWVTQVLTITHTAAGDTSFDARLSIPEPTTLSILGIGLAAVGLINRRRERR